MKNIMQGRTSFVIAHRLSTISDANLILVMKGGDIIEQGNHQQLFGANGFYADLYNSQFSEGQYVKENEIIGYVEHLETFRSPFDGLVVRSYAVQNQVVWLSEPLAVIADINNLHIRANIEETHIIKIQKG